MDHKVQLIKPLNLGELVYRVAEPFIHVPLHKEYSAFSGRLNHRNQTISRKGANIISRRPSHGHLARRCCPPAFLRIFSEVTYIRTVGNSTLFKNLYITKAYHHHRCMYFRDTTPWLIIWWWR
jgi:hypothetical protein